MIRKSLYAAPLGALALFACQNPAADKPKAAVADPSPQVEAAVVEEAAAEQLAFSQEGSRIDWVGSKVTGKHDGGFERFSGTVEVAGDTVRSVKLEIDMNSVWSDTEKLTGHLRTDDFFAVETYPTATFATKKLVAKDQPGYTHLVTGDLTLRGVTREITFPAQIAVTPEAATARSEFALNRKDFGIAYAGKKDDLIRDDVVLRLAVQVARAAAPTAAVEAEAAAE